MIRMRNLLGLLLITVLSTAGAVRAVENEKPLDNAEIIKLTKLEMGDAVIIAKIKSAASVNFATSTDDLVKLKTAGVTKPVIAALLDRSATPPAAAPAPAPAARPAPAASASASSANASVTLQSKDGSVVLKSIDGDVKTIVAPFVGWKRFIVFDEVAASVRTKDHRPSVTIASDKDPGQIYWLVKLDQDKDAEDMNRSIDVESPGMWGGNMSSAPDNDFRIKCEKTEEKPGLWRFTPVKDLKPGEYGVYIGKGEQSGTLFDFGIDK